MSIVFRSILASFCRFLLSLRYRIEVKGLETLTPERLNKGEGILFLPNHPALMDPSILFVYLWPKFRMRPLMIEYIYNLPMMKWINRLVKPVSVPNFDTGVNEWKVKNAEKAMREIASGLQKGENFILYPSGQLKSTPKEIIGGASATHELLKECPRANVVLIRTTGFWGSSFSRAIVGKTPNLPETLIHMGKVLLKNFIFFAPRRKILVEIEPNPEKLPRGEASRVQINRFLEEWYNRYPDGSGTIAEEEPLRLVSYSSLREEVPTPYRWKERKNHGNGEHIAPETRAKIYDEIRRILEKPSLEIKPEMNLAFDLGMDSLNIAEFIAYLAKNFDVKELHPQDLDTVGSVLEVAQDERNEISPNFEPVSFVWPEEHNRTIPLLPFGRTIPEAFLNSCARMRGAAAVADNQMGVATYDRIQKGALVLAQYFKTWEEERIGLLLPASAGAYVVILALQLAGKVPVMINWTLGPRYIEEMMKLSGAKRIVTSWRFLDRLSGVQFGKALDQLVLLEEVRKKLTLGMKLKGVLLTKLPVSTAIKTLGLDKIDENSPCVILFTSGTEAVPKGVPLSHKNILFNQRSALQSVSFFATDILYGILPPFHSFGFSVAGLLPILTGMRAAFYPDPTDSYALAEGIHRWKITAFISAPSFLKGLLAAAKEDQLKSVRLFVSGAEKASDALFQKIEALKSGAKLIEGYGITECAPILSLNRPNVPPRGVGQILPDVETLTIHPETLEVLPQGSEGEICVRGPNVFAGYLGQVKDPFIEIEGKKWYRTGDLGHFDPDRFLILSGRLKRFVKIGGEMISLGAIEAALSKRLIDEKRASPDAAPLALCADEKEAGRPRLILFATVPMEKEEANQILQQEGFSNLIKISLVKQIDAIPLMGAGKTDYRSLQSLC